MIEHCYSIEPYGCGFLVADYSGNRGEHGAAYCGVSLEWSSQPIVRDPFPTRSDAEDAVEWCEFKDRLEGR